MGHIKRLGHLSKDLETTQCGITIGDPHIDWMPPTYYSNGEQLGSKWLKRNGYTLCSICENSAINVMLELKYSTL